MQIAMSTAQLMARTPRAATDYPGSLISVGSRGESVRQIQKCLNNISVRHPSIPKLAEDGIFGNGTRSAVAMFQSIFSLNQDGLVGPLTWNKIMSECASGGTQNPAYPGYILSVGNRGNEVKFVQHALNVIGTKYQGIPNLKEDGIFGAGTQSAVAAFQRLFNLKQDGLVGPATWAKLVEIMNQVQNGGGTNPPPIPPDNGDLTADEKEILQLINAERAKSGSPALKIDPELQKVARLKAKDMSDLHYFSHTSPTYGSPFDMLQQFGIAYSAAGENIAANSTNKGAVTAWMNSTGHRANILNKAFNLTGIGIAPDDFYGKVFAQFFIEK